MNINQNAPPMNNNYQQHQNFSGMPSGPKHQNNPDGERQELISQVMRLTDEQIEMLPLDQKESVYHLRAQIQNNQMV